LLNFHGKYRILPQYKTYKPVAPVYPTAKQSAGTKLHLLDWYNAFTNKYYGFSWREEKGELHYKQCNPLEVVAKFPWQSI
jgi:hypothetical protein